MWLELEIHVDSRAEWYQELITIKELRECRECEIAPQSPGLVIFSVPDSVMSDDSPEPCTRCALGCVINYKIK